MDGSGGQGLGGSITYRQPPNKLAYKKNICLNQQWPIKNRFGGRLTGTVKLRGEYSLDRLSKIEGC